MSSLTLDRNTNLIFGWVRDQIKDLVVVPVALQLLCLSFLIFIKDVFDLKLICDGLNTDNNIVSKVNDDNVFKSASCYFKNILLKGKNIWLFQITHYSPNALIGIYNNKYPVKYTDESFHKSYYCRDEWDNYHNRGYGLHLNGTLTNIHELGWYGAKYSYHCKNNDMIEMILDLQNGILSYKINSKYYGKAFDIEIGEYRAAITVSSMDCSIKFISFKQIYCPRI